MKYFACALLLFGALLIGACAPFGSDPTPAPDVAALQTQAAALRAVNDAQATFAAAHPTLDPRTATAMAPADATLAAAWAGLATIQAQSHAATVATLTAHAAATP